MLFLDELSEFPRTSLEALRQPLEDGRVVVVRGQRAVAYPARFILVASTNPCPCGFAGDDDRCRCGEAEIARYRRKLSGPLLDRIDLLMHVCRPTASQLQGSAETTSAQQRELVCAARERQRARIGAGISCNAELTPSLLRRYVRLDAEGDAIMRSAYEQGRLSARGRERVLRVARTIADLRDSERVAAEHLFEALSLRQDYAVASGMVP